jgi:3-hydroxyacyl-[acyl-carrier-protein] dehydratase
MPGVLIIEAMAQTAAIVVKVSSSDDKLVYFMSVEEAKFRKPVLPGDVLFIHVTKERSRGDVWKFKGNVKVEGNTVAEAVFTAMMVNKS